MRVFDQHEIADGESHAVVEHWNSESVAVNVSAVPLNWSPSIVTGAEPLCTKLPNPKDATGASNVKSV
jgi:hypothetical protein